MDSREHGEFPAPLIQRVAEDADSRQIADAISALWTDIESALQPVIGRRGVAALFKRTVHVAAVHIHGSRHSRTAVTTPPPIWFS